MITHMKQMCTHMHKDIDNKGNHIQQHCFGKNIIALIINNIKTTSKKPMKKEQMKKTNVTKLGLTKGFWKQLENFNIKLHRGIQYRNLQKGKKLPNSTQSSNN